MKASELISAIERELKDTPGSDPDVKVQACYEMGLCDAPIDVSTGYGVGNLQNGNLVISFDGFKVLEANGLNPYSLKKESADHVNACPPAGGKWPISMNLKEIICDHWQTVGLLIPPTILSVFEISRALYYSVPIDFPFIAMMWAIFGTVAFFVFLMTKPLKESV